ncbi:MAG: heat-shock protein Hsp70, partial [Deltaproteobacteria bacterium]|nr:heat-shock protein Hsp70 [Deltaproteobacteria bacterium]
GGAGGTGGAGGALTLDRVAVGRHLLLGGDNIDLALAHLVEPRLVGEGERLDATRFTELLLACRDAKERLLSAAPPPSVPLRLAARGSSLVGGTLTTELGLDETRALAADGFFPRVSRGERLEAGRGALVGFGLPYERDPAITRHVARFLERHAASGTPRAVLLNGGVFRSPLLRARLLEVLADLVGAEVKELPGADPDLAVARGAVAYARSLEGQGHRIGGGSARGYYVGIAPEGGVRRAILVVPRGAREGERHHAALPGLSLTVGKPVRFPLFAAEARDDAPGAVVDVDASLEELPAVTARFPDANAPVSSRRRGRGDPERRVAVTLEGELSAIGTLDLACVAGEGDDGRLRLAFDLRPAEATRDEPLPPASIGPAPPASLRPPPSRAPDARLDRARALVEAAFPEPGSTEPGDARHLLRDLEALLGPRASWTLETARGLFDALSPRARSRRRSPEQERVFWLLAGYCLRPGFGHPLDERRVARLAALLPELLAFPEEARGYQQFFIAWRRVAGGLGEPAQVQLRDLLDPFLSTDPDKPRKKKGFAPLAREELLELASSLERVPVARRADLGRWVLERTWTSRDPRLWAAIGRIGARVPVAASAHHVVSPVVAGAWVDHLLRERWGEVPGAARAAAELARATGDRVRDLPERQRR